MIANIRHLDHIAGKTIIRFTRDDPAVLEVDVVVEEQDTCRVLGITPVIKNTVESFPALIRKIEKQDPDLPGNIIVKQTDPAVYVAIIYDIEQNPIVQEAWVEKAFRNILALCNTNKVRTIAMPLLGSTHGRILQQTIFELLQSVLVETRCEFPEKILVYEFPVEE